MIDSGWLFLLFPAFVVGLFAGGLIVEQGYTRSSVNARRALKRAEAYEVYKKALGK